MVFLIVSVCFLSSATIGFGAPSDAGSGPADRIANSSDDFEDRVLDESFWLTGSEAIGVGCPVPRPYACSFAEVTGVPDGYLDIGIRGLSPANSCGANAPIRTLRDFHGSRDHVVNFALVARLKLPFHVGDYAVELHDKRLRPTTISGTSKSEDVE